MSENVVCPGCGVVIKSETRESEKDFNASVACRKLYYDLSYYTLSLQDPGFIHQLIVDAYAAQHVGARTKPITITFALAGLYLVNEKGFDGRRVQLIHIAMAKKNKSWPDFHPPESKEWLMAKEVMEVPDNLKQEMIRKWSASVWEIWEREGDKIQVFLKTYL